ncbi:(Fe-S)-binding protein [Millisia brevis]|uniref:(Fe-S)-binding protein n=1 Tax=Millisia brevis TaxID=264148 RepID=UPI00082CE4BC|nr:(Fe-S)-binding protein [Millisia brevis]
MSALTITLGTIGWLFCLVAWASFLSGVWNQYRTIRLGQPAPDRWRPIVPRMRQMLIEFIAHTRMVKFRTVGWAHWLVMIGFLGGFLLYFEAYGQTLYPEFHWPFFGDTFAWHLWDELLGIGTVVGILTLIVIRQLNHPRVPARLSRFSGSRFGPAYLIEMIVLVEGLGMIFVKAGKIATFGHANPYSDFFTMQVARLLPESPELVSVFALIKMLSGGLFLYLVGRNLTWGVAWHRFSAFPNIYFKRQDDGSVALGAAKPMMSGGKPIDMETADPDTDTFGVGRIEDFSWKGWLDFTTCTECGRCQSQCPAWNTGKPLSPKLLIMSLRDHAYAEAPYLLAGGRKDMAGEEVGLVDADGKPDEAKLAAIPEAARLESDRPLVGPTEGQIAGGIIDPDVLWSCTTCGACVEQCPVDIEHVDHIIDMRRYQVLIESEFPSELAGLFKNLENKGNPWGQNSKDRLNWISEMDFPITVFGDDTDSFEGYEYLFWVGCAGAYEDRAKKTTKAVAELLATAGVKFLVLGQGETCTGDSARRAGNEFLFQQLAQQNIEMIDSVFEGLDEPKRKVIVTCAHCLNALKNEYAQLGANYEVVHHTQLLNRLVRQKRLIPVAKVDDTVTYHDPCYLGRHNKIYNAPREVIAESGSVLTEMPRHGERSMCCGAGGARMWMEEHIGKRINVDRVDEAIGTLDDAPPREGRRIATGCPFCRVMLTDGLTARQELGRGENVEVIDVAQLMLESITRLDAEQLGKNIEVIQTEKVEEIEAAPEPAPVAEQAVAAAPTAAAGGVAAGAPKAGGLGMKGGAKTPGAPAAGAPKAGGLGMKGGAKAPGAPTPGAAAGAPAAGAPKAGGLGMQGGIKAPGAKAPGAPAAGAPKAGGLGMKGGAKAPGAPAAGAPKAGGLGMKGGIKAPGAQAPGAPAAAPAPTADTPSAPPAAPPKAPAKGGLGMKGIARTPGAGAPKAPGGGAPKAPGAAKPPTPAAEAPAGAETPAPAAPAVPAPATPAIPTAKGGLGMKGIARTPGAGAPKPPGGAAKAAPTPPPADVAEVVADTTEVVTADPVAEQPAAPEPAAPKAAPGGLGMKGITRAPGRRGAPPAPGRPATPATSPVSEDVAVVETPDVADPAGDQPTAEQAVTVESVTVESVTEESVAPAETNGAAGNGAAPATNGSANGQDAPADVPAPPVAKPGGLGMKGIAKPPGRR